MVLDTRISTLATTKVIGWDHSVVELISGGLVVTWSSYTEISQDGNYNSDIYSQRFNNYGVEQGTVFMANTYTTSDQYDPSMTALANGGFVVTWSTSRAYDLNMASNLNIVGQRYDSNGVAQGTEFLIGITGSDAKVAELLNGDFVVTWTSWGQGQDGDESAVQGQRYDANGVAQGAEFQINTYTTLSQYVQSVTALGSGFVVVWASVGQDGSDDGVYGQRYDANGTPQGTEFKINTYTSGVQTSPSVAALIDGSFIVSWLSVDQDGPGNSSIYGQHYDANGIPQGTEFKISTHAVATKSSVAGLSDGGFIVTWAYDDIFGQRYDANGVAQGTEFRINTYSLGAQFNPSVAALSEGGFVVTWESTGQDGVTSIYGKRYDVNGIEIKWVNDAAPVALPIALTTVENVAVSVPTLPDYAYDVDAGDSISVIGIGAVSLAWAPDSTSTSLINPRNHRSISLDSLKTQVTTSRDGQSIIINPDAKLDYLKTGQKIIATLDYTVSDSRGLISTSPITLTILGSTSDKGVALNGNKKNNTLNGSKYEDVLQGNDGNDTLTGRSGIDVLYGGVGNDKLSGGSEADYLYGGSGNDNLDGGTENDILDGGIGNDIIYGGAGLDTIIGGRNADIKPGGNLFKGELGDVLTGGTDQDEFIFNIRSDTAQDTGKSGGNNQNDPNIWQDIITDYGVGGDRIIFDVSGNVDNNFLIAYFDNVSGEKFDYGTNLAEYRIVLRRGEYDADGNFTPGTVQGAVVDHMTDLQLLVKTDGGAFIYIPIFPGQEDVFGELQPGGGNAFAAADHEIGLIGAYDRLGSVLDINDFVFV
jgi:Ca2+-binding RTX toxin-like protein